MKHLKKVISAAVLMLAVFTFYLGTALPVFAESELILSTPFPGMTVSAGKTVTFSLTLDNPGTVPLNTAVSVSELPDGWSAHFTGGGNQVSRVFVRADNMATVQLAIDIPFDTKEGEYKVLVSAKADEAEDTLVLSLKVSEMDLSQGLFTSQFPELQGGANTTFTFNADLKNSSSEDRYYSLNSMPPEGWQVAFRPTGGSSDIASLTIPAGDSQAMTITVKPPATITAGEYQIPCAAVSATESKTLDLKVIITGNYALKMTTKDGRMNADVQIGKETPVTLIVFNEGSADMSDISLTSVPPTAGWSIRFDPATTIDKLAAGAFQEVIAYIQPDPMAVTGDYAVTIAAGNKGQTSTQLDLRVAVKTSTMWGVVAVIIIALLALGLYFVFRKFGRR